MHIFTSDFSITTKDGTTFFPGVRYVLPDGFARTLERGIIEQRGEGAGYRLSHFNSYERRYHGQQLFEGDTLDIYRHGAIGDTLMTTAVVAEIRRRNPFATINLYTRPGNVDLWHGIQVNVIPGFPVFDEIRGHHHLFYENMLEANSEPDQECAVDTMLCFAGIDPESVPAEKKLPLVWDKNDTLRYVPKEPYILLQVGASNGNRNYPHSSQLHALLTEAFPGVRVFVLGEHNKLPKFRDCIPLVRMARLVICPDSSIGHLAAAFPSVPVISLWGLFHPNDRIKYYRNHHPLVGFSACPHAPCRSHEFKLPARKCIHAQAFDGQACAALASITPEMIVVKAKELLCVS